jgi:hypothetical protein
MVSSAQLEQFGIDRLDQFGTKRAGQALTVTVGSILGQYVFHLAEDRPWHAFSTLRNVVHDFAADVRQLIDEQALAVWLAPERDDVIKPSCIDICMLTESIGEFCAHFVYVARSFPHDTSVLGRSGHLVTRPEPSRW